MKKNGAFRKTVGLVLALLVLLALLPSGALAATGGHSQEEAVSWIRSLNGTYLDFDHAAGCQCVDPIKAYYDYLGVGARRGNAEAYRFDYMLPDGWTRVESNPQPGDVVVWGPNVVITYYNTNHERANSTYGHIGLVTEVNANGQMQTLEQNAPEDSPCQLKNRTIANATCFLRPDFCSHDASYRSASNGVCQLCHAWNPACVTTVSSCDTWLTLKGSEAKPIRPGPFNDCGEVRKLASGQKVHAVAIVRNGRSSGNWYWLNADDSGNSLDAYVYSDNVKTTTAPPFQVRLYGLGENHKNASFSVGETNAMLTGMLSVTGSASNADVSRVGVVLADASGIELASTSEEISTSYDPIYMWFDVNSELGYTLSPGTTYYYMCFAVIRGNTVFSEAMPFTTQGSSSAVQVSFYGFGQPHKNAAYSVGETNAVLTGLLSVSGGASNASVSETGIVLCDAAGNQLGAKSEAISTSYDTIYLWYDVNSELGVTLSPGTNYSYRFYAVVNGTAFYSEPQLFTTEGTASGPELTVSFYEVGQSHKFAEYAVGETNAMLTSLLTVSGAATNANVTHIGLELYDAAGAPLGSTCWTSSDTHDVIYVWVDVNGELGVTLTPGTEYGYRYFARIAGTDYYSDLHSFTTAGAAPAPSAVQVSFYEIGQSHKFAEYSVGETNAVLTSLLTVSGAATNANVTHIGLELYDAAGIPLDSTCWTSSDTHDVIYVWVDVNDELGYTLTPGTEYRYRYFARIAGTDYYSDVQSFTTAGTAPLPTDCVLTLSGGRNGSFTPGETVTLSFGASGANYFILKLYKDGELLKTFNTDESVYTEAFAEPGSYRASAAAVNSYGQAFSDEVSWTVEAEALSAPGPVASITAQAQPGAVVVSWSAAEGADHYRLARQTTGTGWILLSGSISGTTYEDATAVPGSRYRYLVCAENELGKGEAATSAVVTAVAARTAPGPVESVTAQAQPGVNVITWSPAEGADHYRLARQTTGAGWELLNGNVSGTAYEDETAVAGKRYRYLVCAENELGKGEAATSAVVTAVAARTAPGPVESVTAQAQPGVNLISWTEAEGADHYRIARQTTGSSWVLLEGNCSGTAYEDGTAAAGKRYRYLVCAENEVGKGEAATSAVITAVAARTAPGPVESLAARALSGVNVITWSPAEGADHYRIARQTTGSSWILLDGNVSGTGYLDENVVPGKRYRYLVCAENELGKGESATSAVVTAAAARTVPGPVESVTAQVLPGVNVIRWTEAEGADHYRIARQTTGSSWVLLNGNVSGTGYLDENVVAGKRYRYLVCAENEIGKGESATSAVITALQP